MTSLAADGRGGLVEGEHGPATDVHAITLETIEFLIRAGVQDTRITAMRAVMDAAPAPKAIPAGKILIANPGDVGTDEVSRMAVLEEAVKNGKTYQLYRRAPGYDLAGSMLRWTNGGWGVRIHNPNGTYGGAGFKTAEEAVERFNLWTRREDS